VQLKTRNLYNIIEIQNSWDSRVSLQQCDKVISELHFWKNNLTDLNSKQLCSYNIPKLIVSSDASSEGIAAFFNVNKEFNSCYKNLTELEKSYSSIWRELYAIQYALHSFTSLQNKYLLWQTDSYPASRIVKVGSSKIHLQLLAENINDKCRSKNIKLDVHWIPRDKNKIADYLSRNIDHDDWQTTKSFFTKLNKNWGPFTVDRFADNENAKVKTFNSKYWCPNTCNVNAFSISWEGENNFLVPPVYLVPRVLKHMQVSKCKGTLVVSYWPSAIFWPTVVKENNSFYEFVKDYRFDDSKDCLQLGNHKNAVLGSSRCKSLLLSLKIDFSQNE